MWQWEQATEHALLCLWWLSVEWTILSEDKPSDKPWGREMNGNRSMKIIFRGGMTLNESIQENQVWRWTFHDILQWNFYDPYYNLTLKSIAILRWTAYYCSQVKFMWKWMMIALIAERCISFVKSTDPIAIYGRFLSNSRVNGI